MRIAFTKPQCPVFAHNMEMESQEKSFLVEIAPEKRKMKVDFTDNSKEILDSMREAISRAMEKCGIVAEGYAKDLCPVDTGNLRNSISHLVDEEEPAAYIGSNTSYAAYVELGTGRYAEGGRPTPWVYQDDEGNWHWTAGNPAQPFLKPAVADHTQTYQNIIEDELKNG